MNLGEYRKAVIESVPCPYERCLALRDESCVRIVQCLNASHGGPHEHQEAASYVHDERSLAFHRAVIQVLRGHLDDPRFIGPRFIGHAPVILAADLEQFVSDLESGARLSSESTTLPDGA